MHDEFLLSEKYRPRTIEECILPPRLMSIFKNMIRTNVIPDLMLCGTSGVGKTTVAKALCEQMGLNYLFINSSKERGIDVLRHTITGYASTMAMDGKRKVIILDEADGLTPEAQNALRGSIEEFSNNCSFILTCNHKAKLIDAIHSRCAAIDFALAGEEKALMASQFFKRLCSILEKENIKFEKQVIIKLIERHFPDYRRILNEIQKYAINGIIDTGILVQISDIRNIKDLINALKEKNFNAMRKWVAMNSDTDPNRIFRKIYDGMQEYMEPASIPQCIVILSKYQYQAAFVSDAEINLVACLTEIMVDCNFKKDIS